MFIYLYVYEIEMLYTFLSFYETENNKAFTFFPEKIYMLFMSLCKRHNGTGLNVALGL